MDPTDNNSTILRVPGHYERTDPFILYKSDDFEQAMQSITASNLLNRLESLNFCTQAETKEYYEH